MIHELKTWPSFYQALVDCHKTFEIRKNDRNFEVGDDLVLKEYDHITGKYTGRESTYKVTYLISEGPWLPEGYVVMSIVPLKELDKALSQYTDALNAGENPNKHRMAAILPEALRHDFIEAAKTIDVLHYQSKLFNIPTKW